MIRSIALCFCLAACTQFPELDSAVLPDAPAPSLMPTDALAVTVTAAASRTNTLKAEVDPLLARADALNSRADILRNR